MSSSITARPPHTHGPSANLVRGTWSTMLASIAIVSTAIVSIAIVSIATVSIATVRIAGIRVLASASG